jgi:hypothetical protein
MKGITVFDLEGRKLRVVEAIIPSSEISVDVSDLLKGCYVFGIEFNEKIIFKKFLKE